jgi:hypothetical protein
MEHGTGFSEGAAELRKLRRLGETGGETGGEEPRLGTGAGYAGPCGTGALVEKRLWGYGGNVDEVEYTPGDEALENVSGNEWVGIAPSIRAEGI